MNRIVVFAEGRSKGMFDPLDQIRPPFLLRNGVWTVADRWEQILQPASVFTAVRSWLKDCVSEWTGWPVNEAIDDSPDDVWIICGTASPSQFGFWNDLQLPKCFTWISGHDAVIRLSAAEWPKHRDAVNAWIQAGGAGDCPCEVRPIDRELPLLGASGPWDLVDHLSLQLAFDWDLWHSQNHSQSSGAGQRHASSVIIANERTWIASDAELGPHTVIDASAGPVIVDSGAKIEPFSRLCGPAYIGRRTQLVGGKYTGPCAFGPGCKLGGEVETSIFQGFSNKVHEGFFGHGMTGEWVNLGALTTNSDLKNTYGTVRVARRGETVDTGSIKVGSYLSDHVKTGIGTLLPTGAAFGVGVNIVAGGLTPKSIPPFVWGGAGDFMVHDVERMLKTARIAVERRADIRALAGLAREMTQAEADALRICFERSAHARDEFLAAHG